MPNLTGLDQRQIAAILAGLRLLGKTAAQVGGLSSPIQAIFDDDGAFDALSLNEIDALCEAMNIEPSEHYAHPHQEIAGKILSGKAKAVVLNKKSWDGYRPSSSEKSHEFIVEQCGPEWIKIRHTHNGAHSQDKPPFWITWKDFGSFSIK